MKKQKLPCVKLHPHKRTSWLNLVYLCNKCVEAQEDEGSGAARSSKEAGGSKGAKKAPKVRKDGKVKRTRGAHTRRRYTNQFIVAAIALHELALASGSPPVDHAGHAAGTTVPHSTLFKGRKQKEKYEEQAGRDERRKLSRARLGWWRKLRIIKEFNKKLLKGLRQLRDSGRVVSTRIAMVLAQKVYEKVDQEKGPTEAWPTARRTGTPWQPKFHWVRSWLRLRGWGQRKSTKKRVRTTEQDCASMQRYLDKLRWRLAQPPPYVKEDQTRMDFRWGHYPLCARFSADQVGIQFDHTSAAPTWAGPEERSAGFIHVRGGPSGWEKRMATWHMCYSAQPSGPQPPATVIFRGQGRITAREKTATTQRSGSCGPPRAG